jgi:hypothetical protein
VCVEGGGAAADGGRRSAVGQRMEERYGRGRVSNSVGIQRPGSRNLAAQAIHLFTQADTARENAHPGTGRPS